MSNANDRELINLILSGNSHAADLFVERFSRFVFCVLKRDFRLSQEDAEDIFQQVWLRLWEGDYRRLRHWQGSGSFVPYLGIIVRNLAADHFRSHPSARNRSGESESEKGDDAGPEPGCNEINPEKLAALEERRRMVRKASASLSQRDQELLQRRYFRQQSYAEIAADMDMTVNNVGVALSRAEARLGEILHSRDPDLFPYK
ncbi:MAG: sigma-70 family RNA polymerase sigma factor [Acidobacteriia bacterium]|nr:sigma-70 family RNA polymerase sigma factor [Terriglobia bacterium]